MSVNAHFQTFHKYDGLESYVENCVTVSAKSTKETLTPNTYTQESLIIKLFIGTVFEGHLNIQIQQRWVEKINTFWKSPGPIILYVGFSSLHDMYYRKCLYLTWGMMPAGDRLPSDAGWVGRGRSRSTARRTRRQLRPQQSCLAPVLRWRRRHRAAR